jgi:hypothetical protein
MKIWRASSPVEQSDGVLGQSSEEAAVVQGSKATQELKEEILKRENQVEARNDSPMIERKKKKKKSHKITIGRNDSNDREQSAEQPRGQTLSRLLFSKPTKEQRSDQMKVVYRQFGPDAADVLVVEHEDGMPSPEAADHVIIKVQVRARRRTHAACRLT